jgi:oxygen-independent coproporphyrinogen-3 oxidase
MSALYWHIPFCKKACHYCDFHFETTTALRDNMVSAMLKEAQIRKNDFKEVLSSVYFGGGTPSIVSLKSLEALIRQSFEIGVSSQAEITLEANPDDMEFEFLKEVKDLGFNRLSVGIQSFNSENLSLLNRAHSREQSFSALENAKKAGFENISIDLIYGLPYNSTSDWEKELKTAFSLDIQHLSAYCLTLESGTAFYRWHRDGKLSMPDEDLLVEQFTILCEFADNQEFDHYEVSNLSLPNFNSLHNTNYWKKGSYIGIGPSAHSYNGLERSFNVANNRKYINSLEKSVIPAEKEVLTNRDHVNELLMTGLRTKWGCQISELKNYGYNFDSQSLEKWTRIGFLLVDDQSLKLSKQGWLLADKIASDLFLV